MKTKYFITVLATLFVSSLTVEAQFLDRLKKRVEQKVENVVVEKTANKAAEKASNSMDKMFEGNPFGTGKGKADPALVANSYDFSWIYSLKMTTKEGEMVFDYYLKPNAPYFGFTMATMPNMFTVMDNGKKVTAMFMTSEGNNIGMVTQMPDDMDLEEMKDKSEAFNFVSLPNKTINGYNCKGVKATSSEYETLMYFTSDAEVSFDDIYKNNNAKIPAKLKDYFNPNDKVLMIYMEMKNLKDKKQNATMECVKLEKVTKTIKKSDYKFM